MQRMRDKEEIRNMENEERMWTRWWMLQNDDDDDDADAALMIDELMMLLLITRKDVERWMNETKYKEKKLTAERGKRQDGDGDDNQKAIQSEGGICDNETREADEMQWGNVGTKFYLGEA